MRIQLADLITRPEPSPTPAITLLLFVVVAACLSAGVAMLLGAS